MFVKNLSEKTSAKILATVDSFVNTGDLCLVFYFGDAENEDIQEKILKHSEMFSLLSDLAAINTYQYIDRMKDDIAQACTEFESAVKNEKADGSGMYVSKYRKNEALCPDTSAQRFFNNEFLNASITDATRSVHTAMGHLETMLSLAENAEVGSITPEQVKQAKALITRLQFCVARLSDCHYAYFKLRELVNRIKHDY